ncbi:MAG: HD domain-containing protein [Phycisphaeraceae bacterium]|nr:HD domain-containing protein [Phycisphaeraceae bacterium]
MDIKSARPEMTLALPVMNPRLPGHQLLRIGYELTPSVIERLDEMRVRTIWVDYPSLSFISKYVDPKSMAIRANVVSQMQHTFEALQQTSAAKLNYDAYTDTISRLVDSVISNPEAALFIGDLCEQESGDELMRSGSSVTYLSVLLGLKLEGYLIKQRKHVTEPERAKHVVPLGVGAMLHDIGVTMLPKEVVARYQETHDEADPAWREHPALGFRAVRGRIEPTAATVVLHHHQRYDGNGYAGKDFPAQRGEGIHIFARIAAVADVFTRLSNPADGETMPQVWALAVMLSEKLRGRFDPNVLRALVEVVPPYPPGSRVTLSDGSEAVVIDHDINNPCNPTVQRLPGNELPAPGEALGESIDLREVETLSIVACDGKRTEAYNFGPETIPGNREAMFGWA